MANPTGDRATKNPVYSPDVFLSFAGKDARHGFTSFLYAALRKKGINTFRDDKTTRKGKFFGEEVIHAIEESKVFIVVFSKGYRYSKWCLSELELICKCLDDKEPHKVYPQVYPIFYKIEPRDIRDKTQFDNAMKEANEEREKENKSVFTPDQMEKWWGVLFSVGKLQGEPLKEGFDEAQFVEKIVIDVFKLVPKHVHVGRYIVGVKSRVGEVKSLLDVGSASSNNIVCMLLIHGIGGIGKTTLAKLLFNEIADQFEGRCFLSNVKEETLKQSSGLASLQKSLLKEAHGEDIDFGNDAVGASKIKELLCTKKLLLVLDDVDDKKQLEELLGGCDWFCLGSRIIITSRDNRLLNENQFNKRYEMKQLNRWEALECLCWHAFDKEQPAEGFENVATCALKYANGLPLALEVIGSDLKGESLEEWKCALRDYEKNQHKDILCVLERSYYRLGRNEQQIFLDIACFFKGKRKIYVNMLLQDCENAIRVLEKKSLIMITSGILVMHDLIQQMGREIVLKNNDGGPGHRSRLWHYEDIVNVLTNDSGTDNIKGAMIISRYSRPANLVNWSGAAFCNMKNLQILIVEYVGFSKPPTYLPNNLSWLEWENYPSMTLPSNFSPNKLVVLDLPYSKISGAILGTLKVANLSRLNLSFCPSIYVIPDISQFPNLRELILCLCENLTVVDDCGDSCSKLIRLDLYGCRKLECFPLAIKMPSLEFIDLSCCESLEYFPDIKEQIDTLKSIKLDAVYKMKELPDSINNVIGLKVLSLYKCLELEEMPMFKLRSLEKVTIHFCPRVSFRKSQAMQENDSEAVSCPNLRQLSIMNSDLSDNSLTTILSWYHKLEFLTLSGNSFTFIPPCIKELVELRAFDVSFCHQLQIIPELPSKLSTIDANGCELLTSNSTTMLLSQACKDVDGLHMRIDLPKSKIFPSQFCRLSNCAGIMSFQIGQIFPFAAFAFIRERKHPINYQGLFSFHTDMVQLFINGHPVNETQLEFKEGEVVIVNLRNWEKRKDLDVFLVNDWNNVDIRIDNCYWKCGEYMEVYGVLCNDELMSSCPSIWRNIWNWPGPERIRDFLWLMVREILFTNSQRLNQQLTNSDNCPRCGGAGETVMHAVRDCESIANLWKELIKPCHWKCFSSASICMQDWVLMNLSGKLGRDDGLDWKVTFGFACWNIWENRNKLAFDNSADGAIDHGDRARELIEAIRRAIESQSYTHLHGLNSRELPSNDWVKFNVIILSQEELVNCGCAIQDTTGSWIFKTAIGIDQDIFKYAGGNSDLLIGLLIARIKGFNKIILEVHYEYDDPNWYELLWSENGPIQHILSKNYWQVHIFQTRIESEDVAKKIVDLVYNGEQYSVDYDTIQKWLELDYVDGLKVYPVNRLQTHSHDHRGKESPNLEHFYRTQDYNKRGQISAYARGCRS